ncbi:MAG: hypothetical protein ACM3OC_00025, partial [Deltaproteobacteria bacterium]
MRAAAETGDYVTASKALESSEKNYGSRSRLLFLLEKACLLHLEQKYRESAAVFEQARAEYEKLYTKSVSGFVSSFIFTDYSQNYRGEDFERVLINVFQALNYVMMGQNDEALVEARDADSKLAVINSRYKEGQKNVYREDAFCRMLMGLLYDASPRPQDVSDSCLWFKQALDSYQEGYRANYGTEPPSFLKEKTSSCPPAPQARRGCEVYVIQYKGFAPVKEEASLPVPLPGGYITQIAFPKYRRRPGLAVVSQATARDSAGRIFFSPTECAEDIGAIAEKNLNDRGARAVAVAVAKAGAKYAIEKNQGDVIRKRYGANTEALYTVLASLYNIATNRADLRSWQTLPDKIMIARLVLPPGDYVIEFNAKDGAGRTFQSLALGNAFL